MNPHRSNNHPVGEARRSPTPRKRRAAVYAVTGKVDEHRRTQHLLSCARHAQESGLRVVVMSHDQLPTNLEGLRTPKFQNLAERLNSGEFEVIVAPAPRGGFMVIGGGSRESA